MPGELLGGRYRIIQTLAQGGFGQTYLAEDIHRPGKPRCVVKQLKPARNDPQFLDNARRLFLAEAETLERLGNHDQIPRLLAYFEENQEFYLIQDYIEGQRLTRELSPGEHWPEDQVIQLLQDVLNILFFVHSHGVIHRDLKPDNLIRRNRDWRLVLVDFGSVKQIRSQLAIPTHMTGTIAIGTPGYMSTEQARGRPRFSSDIYSLGVIAIQAATGLNPNQLQEDPHTGEIFWRPWAKISGPFAAILSKMAQYHFKDRYQSATEALQAIDNLLGSDPTTLPREEEVAPVAPALTGQFANPTQVSAVPVSQQPPPDLDPESETPAIQKSAKDFSRFSPEPNPTVMSATPSQSATLETTPTRSPAEIASQTVVSAAPSPVAKPVTTDSATAPEPQPTVMSLTPEVTSTTDPLPAPSLADLQPTRISLQPSEADETPHFPVDGLDSPAIQQSANDSSRFPQEQDPTVMSATPSQSATLETTPTRSPAEIASQTVVSAAPSPVAKPVTTDSATAPEPQPTVMSLTPEVTSTTDPLPAPSLADLQPTRISLQPSEADETPTLDQSIEEPQPTLDLLDPEEINPEPEPIKIENVLAVALATASAIATAQWRALHTSLSHISASLSQFQPTRSHYLAGTGAVALLVGAIVGYRYYVSARLAEQPPYQPMQSSLATIKQLQGEAHNRLSQDLLQQAKGLADQSQFKDAILMIAGISSPEATELIQQWSEKMLQIATERYQQHGKLEEAVDIANAIPTVAPITAKVPATVEAWRTDSRENGAHVQAAEQALQEGQWQQAIDAARQVSDTPYWQKQASAILAQANAAIRPPSQAQGAAPASGSRPRSPSGSRAWGAQRR